VGLVGFFLLVLLFGGFLTHNLRDLSYDFSVFSLLMTTLVEFIYVHET